MEKIKTKLIQIGNSKGIRIPKHILERLNLHDKIELIIDDKLEQILIKSDDPPRKNWENLFQQMHEKGEDNLLIDDSLDLEEWDW
ncbi:MAG: AbrB/MazE/SpoVT family DNA-binding domain-containing protein [Candidatus Lokiarchaeota archaeon]|nr:AbrB/MazE/SpoVT family DNA-binding domain-containing protein [Candidatus Harpocratesius repetitus]